VRRCWVFDTRTHGHEIRSRCGALREHSGLYERLSAEDNLRFYGRVAHMSERDFDRWIEELLKRMVYGTAGKKQSSYGAGV
jgi:ABC-2 type transport system ATP-binding protein